MIEMVSLSAALSEDWELIESSFRRAGSSICITEDMVGRLREAIESGRMKAWLFISDESPLGVMLTVERIDIVLGRKELVVYAAAGLRLVTNSEWIDCLEHVKEIAREAQCKYISFYTSVSRIKKIAALLGAIEPAKTYYQIPVGV